MLVWKLWRFSLYSTSHGGHLELGHIWLTGRYHKWHNWIPWPQKHRIWCFICIYSSISKGDMTHFDIRSFKRRPSWIRPYLGWYHWANFGKLFILAYRPIFLPISVEKQNKAIFSNWTGFFYFIYWTNAYYACFVFQNKVYFLHTCVLCLFYVQMNHTSLWSNSKHKRCIFGLHPFLLFIPFSICLYQGLQFSNSSSIDCLDTVFLFPIVWHSIYLKFRFLPEILLHQSVWIICLNMCVFRKFSKYFCSIS